MMCPASGLTLTLGHGGGFSHRQEAADHYLADPELLKTVTALREGSDAAARQDLIAKHGEEPTPATARLSELFEANLRAGGAWIPRNPG